MELCFKEKSIKNRVKVSEKITISGNIKYPYFEVKGCEKLCERMNVFYRAISEKYSRHVFELLPNRLKKRLVVRRISVTATMDFKVSFFGEKMVSVVLDLGFSKGKITKKRRFSQLWSMELMDMIPAEVFFKNDRQSRKKLLSLVISVAGKNAENPAFGYYSDYARRLTRNFIRENFFVVPKGLCFFVKAGVVCPEKYGTGNFVLPFSAVNDLISPRFLPKDDEKGTQNADIVNNV